MFGKSDISFEKSKVINKKRKNKENTIKFKK